MKRVLLSVIIIFALVLVFAGCSSIKSGAQKGVHDGVSTGISGIISKSIIGSSSSGSSSSGRNSGGTSTAPERDYQGNSQTVPWPSDFIWSDYGLAGLKQPAGTSVTSASILSSTSYGGLGAAYSILGGGTGTGETFFVSLINGGKPAFDNLVNQIIKIPGAKRSEYTVESNNERIGYTVPGGTVRVNVDLLDGDINIWATSVPAAE